MGTIRDNTNENISFWPQRLQIQKKQFNFSKIV